MHLFICLASLLLTFHLSFLRASNYTLQNVQETNISQSLSYDDIFENTTSLDAATETATYKSTEIDTTSHVVSSTEVDTVKTLTTFTVLNVTSHAQNQTNETSSLPSLNTPNQPVENISVTSLSSSITTEEQLENSSAEYVSTEDKLQNEIIENATFVVQIQTSASKPSTTSIPTTKTKVSTTSIPSAKTMVSTTSIPKTTTKASTRDDFTTSVPPTEVNSATLEYESDKNHDELILSGIFEESHDDYHDDNHLKQTFKNENGNILKPITPINNKITAKFSETAPMPSVVPNNITLFEETAEHNAIHTTDIESPTDKTQTIVVGHKCTRIFQESILWNVTDGGMLALKSCPPGYQGNMYRPCFSNGKWGNVDYSECRLEHLGRMRHMIFHQVQKGMLGNMYVLADEFSKYISSVDMKSPMDRLEAFEILNTFLKLDMNLKMDKSRDIKYIQSLLYSCNELIKKKTVLFSPGSQKNKLITEKAVEMIFDLTYFAEKALRGLLKTQKKQIAFRSTSNVVLYLYRGKLSRQFPLMNFSSDYERDDELSSYFNLEKTLERSAYALIWVKGLHDLLSMDNLLVNSDVAVATILSPLNSLNHLLHPPTFDIGLRIRKEVPEGYTLKCGQLWNMSQSAKLTEYLDIPTGRWFNTRSTQNLWNTEDCIKASRKGDIVTCRCHHLGSISLLLEEEPQATSGPSPPVGKLITVSCVTSLSATVLTLVINFLLKRRDQSLSIFILINLLVCLASIQITFMLGINKTDHFEVCLSFAVLLHYLFLVSCFWVVSYSIYLLQRLRSCMEYVGRIRDYCAFCWMLPTLLLIISFVVNPNGYETKQFCWLNVQRGILWSFVIPVTGLILVNTIVMILALKTFNEQMSVTHRVEICKTRNSMRAGITLLPFFAINWFFGILAVEDPENMSLQVIFALTNSMQGILTFVFFCVMDNNVQMLFRLKFHEASRKPKVSAMRLKKSGSFPILERPLITLTDDNRRNDCTPLLSQRTNYSETSEDPCCSNIRV